MEGCTLALKPLGSLSAEGGPLLVLDASLLHHWHGVDGTGADYERACAFFDAGPAREGGLIDVGLGSGLLWEMGGAGTAHVFASEEGRCVIARTWLNADEPSAAARLAGLPMARPTELGILETPADHAVVLWATENAGGITALHGKDGRPEGGWAMTGSALTLRTVAARHRFFHDAVESADGSARRLHMSGL